MLDFVKKNKRILYIIGLVVCAALFVVLGRNSIKKDRIPDKVYSIHAHNDRKTDDIYWQSLTSGGEIRQSIIPDSEIAGISFCFHKAGSGELKGQTFLTIIRNDSSGRVYEDVYHGEKIYEDVYDNTKLPMDTLVDFGLYDIVLEPGCEYELVLTSDVENEQNAPQIYLQNAGAYRGNLSVNGTRVEDKSLCFGAFKVSGMPGKIFNIILAAAVAVLAVVLVLAFVMKQPVHRVFIAACVGFGSVYMLIVAPGKGCDSWHHFRAAYNYSNIMLLQGGGDGKLYMRADDLEFYKKNFAIIDGYYALMSADAYMDLRDTASLTVGNAEMVDSGMDVPELGSFIPYIPYSLGLWLGRLLYLGALPTVYLGRLFGLITFALMISLAVKIIPVGKEMLAFTALMPMTLQEYSAFSYDGMCIASAFLFTACWLAVMHGTVRDGGAALSGENDGNNKAFSKRVIMIIWIVSAVLLGAGKQGTYVFFLLLLIAVNKARMSFKEKMLVGGSITASALIFNIVRFAIVAAEAFGLVILAADGKYMPGTDYTLSYAVEHPWQFFLMCVGSLIEKADYYIGSTIGTHLSANIQTVPLAVVIPFLVIILAVSLETQQNRNSSARLVITAGEKLAMTVSFLITCFVMFFMMQVSTPVGWNIDGVTGRYFLPLLPLVFLCIHGNGMTIGEGAKNKAMALFYCWHIVEIFYAVWGVVIR